MVDLNPRLSVVVIVKDEVFIHDTLLALQEQCKTEKAECVVIDASEGRIDHIRSQHTWVNWIDFQSPPGVNSTISLQRNLGVKTAKSPIIMFCDAGNIPEKDWVRVLSAPILSGKYDLVGGPLIFFHNGKDISKRNWAKDGEEVQYPTCGNMAFTRSAYDKTSGFNTSLLVAEDDDFTWALSQKGITSATVTAAVMRMDIGNRRRRFKRAWRYGKGIVNLLKENPDLRKRRFTQNPDILIYPAMTIAYPIFLLLGILNSLYLLAPVATTALILAKNRNDENVLQTHIEHFVYAAGTITEVAQQIFRRLMLPPILQYPNDNSAYIEKLVRCLNHHASVTSRFPEFTSSASLNLLLTPILTPLLKMRGVRVVNIHWLVGKWQLHWAQGNFSRKILWVWFNLWIASLRLFRIRITYTVHDLNFHSKIFPDDQRAIELLIANSDCLVFLNEFSEKSVKSTKSGQNRVIIPEGPLSYEKFSSRAETRKRLNVGSDKHLLILIGILDRYKGIDNLLRAAEEMPSNISIRIAGNCRDPYKSELSLLLATLREKGLDVEIDFGFMPDELFSDYLYAADFFIYPCREINNSGSLNAALTAGLPLIVPTIAELEWIPDNCKILLSKKFSPIEGIQKSFLDIVNMRSEDSEKLRFHTREWANSRSWEKCSEAYSGVYRRLLNE